MSPADHGGRSGAVVARLAAPGWIDRARWPLLALIVAVAGIARSGGLSSGTLYRDDAWVALTTRVPLGTAARMVVTTPGFVLGERAWIGWFPHTVWLEQLPTLVLSLLGVVAVYGLVRWWGLGPGAALVAAGMVAVALTDVVYATRVKPYSFDLLAACAVLWLAERVRRGDRGAAIWLAVASVGTCAVSLGPVPLVVGVWVALGLEALVRRRLDRRLAGIGIATALGLGALWLAVRPDVSPRLRTSWNGYYLVVTSVHGLAHSARTILDGFLRGVGDTTPGIGLHGLGQLDRAALGALALVGAVVGVRRHLLPLAAIAAAVTLSIPRLVPLGTGRTDAYLYPAFALLVAEGAAVCVGVLRRHARPLAAAATAGTVVVAGLLAADRLAHRPHYPGGDLRVVAAVLKADRRAGQTILVGGTARWPWAYYEAPSVQIGFSHLYNNGYYPIVPSCPGCLHAAPPQVLVLRGSAIEGGYAADAAAMASLAAENPSGAAYVESADWPSMPTTLLADLEARGLRVASYEVLDGYRYWDLVTTRGRH